MFHQENFQTSFPYSDDLTSSFVDDIKDYEFGLVSEICSHEFSSMNTSPEASNDSPFSIQYLTNMFPNEYVDCQGPLDEASFTISTDDFSPNFEELDSMFIDEIDGLPKLSLEENEICFDLQQSPNYQSLNTTSGFSMEMTSDQPALYIPYEDMEIDSQQRLLHLLMAFGEAIQNGHRKLAEVIVKLIHQAVSLIGDILERLLYYLFDSFDKQSDFLKVESKKNFHAAFMAFYQIFPYGKFAHFAANSAILEAMPKDEEVVHIFDFDMGDGVQWSSFIESIAHQDKELRLTSIKWDREDSSYYDPSQWKFEETKKRLHDHARSFNLKLQVEEIPLHNMLEMKNMVNHEVEWCAFNCMASLPHMGRLRSRKDVAQFLSIAKEFLTNTCYKGILTFGDGDVWEKLKMSSDFTSFLDGHLVYYQHLLESFECPFPVHFREAKTAMECLFVAPFVSSDAWIRKWEETRECWNILSSGPLLEGWKMSKESVMEAKEMVKEGESLYGVRVEGEHCNQMVLDWRGTELVRVSCWRS